MCESGRKRISEISAIRRDLVSVSSPTEHNESMSKFNTDNQTTKERRLAVEQAAYAHADSKAKKLGYDSAEEMLMDLGFTYTKDGKWFDENGKRRGLLEACWEAFYGED